MRVANLVPVGLLALAYGCGSGDASPGTGTGGGAGHDGGVTGVDGPGVAQVPRPPLPQVVTFGGPVLTAPKVQPIVYGNDSGSADMHAFLQELTTSSYWSDTTAEYGVGKLTVLPAITLAATAPASITTATVTSDIATNTSGSSPAWGAADPSTIYLFLFPAGTTENDDISGACCVDFDGFHDETPVGAISVPYAIICACPGFDGKTVTDTQQRTVAISHELVESSTDPFPDTDPAYVQTDDADIVWTVVTDGEVADMCELNDDTYYIPPGSTYMIQRIWSNAAAAQSQIPCVPHGSVGPYFNSTPALGMVNYTPPGGTGAFDTQGISIPIGQSRVIDLDLFSAAATAGPWTVSAYDYNDVVGVGTPNLTLALDKTTGMNGDTLHLTVTVKSADSTIGGEAFLVFSDYGQPGDADFQENVAMGLVVNN